ncbi:unnamed protein product [Triticum turgidum subsp. durum]|uniref:Protein kinase domain-containing protein n=1 Tax=Triticum turgidum subsp. durum TaxID=4567 RepID=A0A9R1AD24_TRITD|nr:unnamed protein product [Triticum turgidum subsp. durum]
MGNCASAMEGLIPWGWGAKPAGMSASKRTTSSSTTATTGKLSTVSTSTFMASTVSGGSTDDCYEEEGGHILESPNLRIFTFAELRGACRNFKPETVLGEGGFGKVYKGWIDVNPAKGSTAMVVAVKKLNPESVQGMEQWQVIVILVNWLPLYLFFYFDEFQ